MRNERNGTSRREFLAATGAALGPALLASPSSAREAAPGRPNILWLVSEDNNPYIGAYGDSVARTPAIDALARSGVLYENCFSQAPVCAPSRFTLISGMYATSCGPANHMRASGQPPRRLRGFPAYMRGAGYYCTNNAKTDYNAPIDMRDTWDESSGQAHWRNRPAGKPFFAVFNYNVTHESQVFPQNQARFKPLPNPTDPAHVRMPAYLPDTPETRRDRANYYDQMARLDAMIAARLAELEADGLADDTIVFYYGDNGGVLPRSKRFLYDSGLHVPLIIRFPSRWRQLAPATPGSRIASPVSFVDFAPTVLSLAQVSPPDYLQGHAFAGLRAAPQRYAFSFRDRMDERYDMSRSARDERYRYTRHYKPHLIWGQHVEYMWQQTGVAVWDRLHHEGKLSGPQDKFWHEKPAEELYDLAADPDEVNNLANDPAQRARVSSMRQALEQHMLTIRDNGFIPEGSPLEGYENTRDPKAYPLEEIMRIADTATRRDPVNLPRLMVWMADRNECIRYWAALGCLMLREKAAPASENLCSLLQDSCGSVRVAAAEALCYTADADKGRQTLEECLLRHDNPRVRLQAANAFENIGPRAAAALPALEQAAADPDDYVKRAVSYTVIALKQDSARVSR